MRTRFSIRWMFVIVTLMAIGLYVLFVRPTVIADGFVTCIQQSEYDAAFSLFRGPKPNSMDPRVPNRNIKLVYAEVLPREWSDIWAFQRKVVFRIGYQASFDGRHVEWTTDVLIFANFDGVRLDPDNSFAAL